MFIFYFDYKISLSQAFNALNTHVLLVPHKME